ncbi:DUF429 domain-containing protein [Candidatus Bathyarchaeota archaeon]|nr:DUF429 domain-containing protein [Candidatus Bathyarchaeota archaeon]
MNGKIIIGIDLSASELKPTGWAKIENRTVKAIQLYTDEEIVETTVKYNPTIVAIDAPLTFPKKGIMRKADREMYRLGYPVFPPLFRTMQKLTARAVKLSEILRMKGLEVIEVHPTSSRKALSMPTKDWRKIQALFKHIGLRGEHERRKLTRHEIDAVTAALTGWLHLHGKTMLVGEPTEGCIVVPIKNDWRKLKFESR